MANAPRKAQSSNIPLLSDFSNEWVSHHLRPIGRGVAHSVVMPEARRHGTVGWPGLHCLVLLTVLDLSQ